MQNANVVQKRHQIAQIDLLLMLKKELIADEMRLNFNYLEFTYFCSKLLANISGAGKSRCCAKADLLRVDSLSSSASGKL